MECLLGLVFGVGLAVLVWLGATLPEPRRFLGWERRDYHDDRDRAQRRAS